MKGQKCSFAWTLPISMILLLPLVSLSSEQVPAPVARQGSFWRSRVKDIGRFAYSSREPQGDYEVWYVEGNLRVFEISGNEKTELGQEVNTEILTELIDVWRGEQKLLKFPVTIGNRWQTQYSGRLRGGRREYLVSADYEIKGIETKETQAGSFSAFKIEKNQTGPVSHTRTYFYTTRCGCIVYSLLEAGQAGSAGKTEIELIDFGSLAK